jgi:hypothetical protein
MNLVERFFRDLSEDVVLPGGVSSVEDLSRAILAYLEQMNLDPQRYEMASRREVTLERTHAPEKHWHGGQMYVGG